MRAVITVIGKDKVGIIAAISSVLASAYVNILDINQTILQDIFSMVMLVDISQMKTNFNDLTQKLQEVGKNLGLSVMVQHEDIFNSMHRI